MSQLSHTGSWLYTLSTEGPLLALFFILFMLVVLYTMRHINLWLSIIFFPIIRM